MIPAGSGAPSACHAVHFFGDDAQLFSVIGAFLAEGFEKGEPALVVTSLPHRAGIVGELQRRQISADDVVRKGDLLLLDAEETLRGIMRGGLPDSESYHCAVGTVLDRLLAGRPGPVRIFGDMVDLLWQRKQFDAAIRIEILSNELAATHPILVICGYSMGHFLKQATRLREVCELHGRASVPRVA